MTNNQILYQRNLEERRTHMANEALKASENAENRRHNVATEHETGRHNAADEGIRMQQNAITNAHYQRSDATERSKLAESIRHNQKQEDLTASDQKLRQDIANAQISSSERVASADRISRESIAGQDRAARLTQAAQDRRSREQVAAADRSSNEKLSAARNKTQLEAAGISQAGSLTRTLVDGITAAFGGFGSGLANSIKQAAPTQPVTINNNVSYGSGYGVPGDWSANYGSPDNDRSPGDNSGGRSFGFQLGEGRSGGFPVGSGRNSSPSKQRASSLPVVGGTKKLSKLTSKVSSIGSKLSKFVK